MIDDFCVEKQTDWLIVGRQLFNYIKSTAAIQKIVQIIIVCGQHDRLKQDFLESLNLDIASLWYIGRV